MNIDFDLNSSESYREFLAVKSLPRCQFRGRTATVPDEYADRLAARLGRPIAVAKPPAEVEYIPHTDLFDYQRDIARLAIDKRKFAVFADCGLGKTMIMTEFARHVAATLGARGDDDGCILIVSPLMVIPQTIAEIRRWYSGGKGADGIDRPLLTIDRVAAKDLSSWVAGKVSGAGQVGITNWDALTDGLPAGPDSQLRALILDESSYLKSHYGKWGQVVLDLGRGLEWKLCLTGTPAPNDRIEYANHAVFLDAFPTVNSFLARFFVNRGQTGERWEIKPHAVRPFYRALSHWCIFLTNPATYGWRDNTESIPPINVHIHDVDLTTEQRGLAGEHTGRLFVGDIGGITRRSTLAQLAKGRHKGADVATAKPQFIKELVDSWSADESTIIWCLYNDEQDKIAAMFPGAANLTGTTRDADRQRMIADFQAGWTKVIISKPRILGFGLNLQVATRQVFSGLQDSYESYYQCVKRSNRYGSVRPLNVHIPVTDLERPMIDTVLKKAARVEADTREQEALFRELSR